MWQPNNTMDGADNGTTNGATDGTADTTTDDRKDTKDRKDTNNRENDGVRENNENGDGVIDNAVHDVTDGIDDMTDDLTGNDHRNDSTGREENVWIIRQEKKRKLIIQRITDKKYRQLLRTTGMESDHAGFSFSAVYDMIIEMQKGNGGRLR